MDFEAQIHLARAKHELAVEQAAKRMELINLKVERDKAKELYEIRDLEDIVLSKHEHELMLINYRLKLAEQELKQADARNQIEIEFTARTKALNIVRSSEIHSKIQRIELDSRLSIARELARAYIALDRAEILAETRGLKSIARAWNQYLNTLIVDRLSGHLLQMIAKTLQVDPSFRIKLDRPLRLTIDVKQCPKFRLKWINSNQTSARSRF